MDRQFDKMHFLLIDSNHCVRNEIENIITFSSRKLHNKRHRKKENRPDINVSTFLSFLIQPKKKEQAVNSSFSELQEMEWQYENVSSKLENYANFGNVHLLKILFIYQHFKAL